MVEDRNINARIPSVPKSLGHVRKDGLYAYLNANREAVLRWEKEAPLLLVAAALVDLGGKARVVRTTNLKNRLSEVIDPEHMGDWWKRVQPALRESDQFEYDTKKGTRLRVKPEDIKETSLEELSVLTNKSAKKSQPKAVSDPAERLAEWVVWIQSENAGSPPGQSPPKAIHKILDRLPLVSTPVAMDRLMGAIDHRVLSAKKPATSTSQDWLRALLAVLRRWIGSSDAPDMPLHAIVTTIIRVLDVPGIDERKDDVPVLDAREDLVSWLADYVSKSSFNVGDVADSVLSVSQEEPEGTQRLLSMMQNALDSPIKMVFWQRLIQNNSNDISNRKSEQWLRILSSTERAEVLLSLIVLARGENSILRIGALLQKEWALSSMFERHHYFKATLLAWLSHEELRSEAGVMLKALLTSNREDRIPSDSHIIEWKKMAQSLAQHEIEQTRTDEKRERNALSEELEGVKSDRDRAERGIKYLQGELKRSSGIVALDIKRDAILVLGETLQQLVGSSGPPSRKIEDANAGITLAIIALGADTFGEVGETRPFDPRLYEVHPPPAAGTPVRVTAPGLRYVKGRDSPLILLRMQAQKEG